MSEHEDLNKLLFSKPAILGKLKTSVRKLSISQMGGVPVSDHDPFDENEEEFVKSYVHWTTSDSRLFVPAAKTTPSLIPGVYEIDSSPNIGIYFEKIPVKTEGLLRFPETNSDKVVAEIQKFWERESIFDEFELTYKRGILLYGPPGCHAKGTKVIMADGSIKNVEEVIVGDKLMGPDSKPRRVLELRRGQDDMYRVTPNRGEAFVVNAHHVLNLQKSGIRDKSAPEKLNITLNEYMELSIPAQKKYKLRRCAVEFPNAPSEMLLDPYFLGVWLGDGTEGKTEINTADVEIRDCVYDIAKRYKLHVTEQRKTDSICRSYTISGNGGKGENGLRNDFKELGIFESKQIPDEYLRASKEVRLQLLAGLIDTDGGYSTASWRNSEKFKKKGYKGYFEIIQKRTELADQIVRLARSLGFGVTVRSCKKGIKSTGFEGEYQRINIFGDIVNIPTRLSRKKALAGHPNKDPLRTGIYAIEPLGLGDYYGFILSDDHLYLTSDFMVHHNSGKSSTIQLIMEDVVKRDGIVIKFTDPYLFIDGMRVLRQIQPDTPVVTIIEDIDSTLELFNESEVLNILDGVNEIRKTVFLATTNYPEKLGARIVNRPSRFDKRYRIGYPSAESRKLFFSHLLRTKSEKELGIDLDQWVKDTDEMSIAHLKELFVAVVILGDSYDEAIKTLKSMKECLEDKEYDTAMGFSGPVKSVDFYD